ncbi:hypothetical protein BK816_02560 [Boudabousia tangfeifanii]|uniref:ABC transmembrane type-1 domain-containing protein n=2 Tax=Boudabousia tangfeifanii TaxID=1912795 RepID=A0A1D9MML0_9ACTO|nr:hypothetical protein BK816_02560 [Boudabousia tangfeifanii]
MKGLLRFAGKYLPAPLTAIVLVALWQLTATLSGANPRLLPSPQVVYSSWWADLSSWQTAWLATTFEVLVGMILGCLLGLGMGVLTFSSRFVRRSFYPLQLVAQTIPIIALAPLVLIWFGFSIWGKIALVALYASFPVTIATVKGMRQASLAQVEVAQTLGANQQWLRRHVYLPASWPQVFSGIKISATYAYGTAAMAEYVGAAAGLGVYLNAAKANFRTDLVFVTAITLALSTLGLFLLVWVLERLVVRYPLGEKR